MTTVKNDNGRLWIFNTLHEALNFIKTDDPNHKNKYTVKTADDINVYAIEII